LVSFGNKAPLIPKGETFADRKDYGTLSFRILIIVKIFFHRAENFLERDFPLSAASGAVFFQNPATHAEIWNDQWL